MLPTSEPQLIHTGPTLSEPIREGQYLIIMNNNIYLYMNMIE